MVGRRVVTLQLAMLFLLSGLVETFTLLASGSDTPHWKLSQILSPRYEDNRNLKLLLPSRKSGNSPIQNTRRIVSSQCNSVHQRENVI